MRRWTPLRDRWETRSVRYWSMRRVRFLATWNRRCSTSASSSATSISLPVSCVTGWIIAEGAYRRRIRGLAEWRGDLTWEPGSVDLGGVELGDSAAEGGSFPEAAGVGVVGLVAGEPVEGVLEADGLGEGGGVGELEEDEGGGEGVAGESADGLVWP